MGESGGGVLNAITPSFLSKKLQTIKEDKQIENAKGLIDKLDANRLEFEEAGGACDYRHDRNKERAKQYLANRKPMLAKLYSRMAIADQRQAQQFYDKVVMYHNMQNQMEYLIMVILGMRDMKTATTLAKNMIVGNKKTEELEEVSDDMADLTAGQEELEKVLNDISKTMEQSMLSGLKNYENEQKEELEADSDNPVNKMMEELQSELDAENPDIKELGKLDNPQTLPPFGHSALAPASVAPARSNNNNNNNNNNNSNAGMVAASALQVKKTPASQQAKKPVLQEIEEFN